MSCSIDYLSLFGGIVSLDEIPPNLGDNLKEIDLKVPDHTQYASTLTFKASKKVGKRYLKSLSPRDQYNHMKYCITRVFGKTIPYCFIFEFTQKGLIHAHGVIWLPPNQSNLLPAIRTTLEMFKMSVCDIRSVYKIENWLKYMSKENNFNTCPLLRNI